MKHFFKITVATLISFFSTIFVANAAGVSDENAQTEQAIKKQELDLKRARLRESLKHDQAHSFQRRAFDKQKNQAENDKADYYNALRKQADADSLVSDEPAPEEKAPELENNKDQKVASQTVNNGPREADERTKTFQKWVNSNMMLDSDSKISHKDAMKYEQKEELKKNLLDGNSETVIVKKQSIGKIEKVNKE